MKKLLFVMGWLFVFGVVEAQYKGPRFPINDEWFWKYGSKGLQEGDKMPDIPLGTVLNNKTGYRRFSDLKGKLVILDFWDTYCSSCIEGFPKMVQLQKEFAGEIQIILVNTRENQSDIATRAREMRNFQMPDLPCIVSDKHYEDVSEAWKKNVQPLYKLFPAVGVPHHVWIDGRGVIRLRGGAENTNAAKIKEYLAGKPIQFLKNGSTVPNLFNDSHARYYQQLGYMRNTPVVYGSFITPYTNEVTGSYGGVGAVVDTVNNTRSTYFINQDVLTLYLRCLDKTMRKALKMSPSKQLLFSPNNLNLIEFPPGTNLLDYTSFPSVYQRPLTTEEMIRSRYCYEQTLPLTVSEEERDQMMLEDLNRYFKAHYGITGSVQNKRLKYYELIRTSGIDKIGIENNSGFTTQVVNADGKSILNFQGALHDLFPAWLKNKDLPSTPGFLHNAEGKPFLLFNGTGWDEAKKISMKLPVDGLPSIAELRKLLQAYDLDLVEKEDELPLYVFARADEQTSHTNQ
jgi:thiol-disulfide isomerase/thioredoxin